MDCIYTMGSSSASHTYGNIAAWLKETLLQFFPKDFFTYAYIDSKIAWKNLYEVLGPGDTEFKKRHYPYMIISPKFNTSNDDVFMANTPLTSNMDNAEAGMARNTIFPVIIDHEHGLQLGYKLNRDKVDFEIELRLKTLSQQLDVFKNMQNQMIWNRPFTRMVSLESMIPKSMISHIGLQAGIDITTSTEENNQIPLIMRYLNAHSRYPITYKIRNSTAVDEFFLYYKNSVLLTFTDLQTNDGNKINAVDEYFPLTFRCTAEFNLPGMYAIIGSYENRFHGLQFGATFSSSADSESPNEIIPMYTYTNLYDRFVMNTADGFSFYSSTIVQTDPQNSGKDDIVKMSDVIPPDHMEALTQIINNNVAPETIFRFRLLKNSHELPLNCDVDVTPCEWEIDWKRHQIIIHNTDPTATYRLLIYADMVQINAKFGKAQDASKTDRARL